MELRKKRAIYFICTATIIATIIITIIGINCNSIAYASSTDGIVENNLFENSNFNVQGNWKLTYLTSYSFGNGLSYTTNQWSVIEYKKDLHLTGNQKYTVTWQINNNVCSYTFTMPASYTSPSNIVTSNTIHGLSFRLYYNASSSSSPYPVPSFDFGAEAYGTGKIYWVKIEKGESFTGYVKNSYENYGYFQGIQDGIQTVYDSNLNLLYNGELDHSYTATNSGTFTINYNNSNNYNFNIPYWTIDGNATAIYRKENSGKTSLYIQPNTNTTANIELQQIQYSSGLNGYNNVQKFDYNTNITYTVSIDREINNNQIDMYILYVNTNGETDRNQWTIISSDFITGQQMTHATMGNETIYYTTKTTPNGNYNAVWININLSTRTQDNNLTIYYIKAEKGDNPTPNKRDTYTAYQNGYNIGYDTGYTTGYGTATSDPETQNQITESYNNGYETGYNKGNGQGYTNGYEAGKNEWQQKGYENGYQIGYQVGSTTTSAGQNNFTGLLTSIFNTPINMFFGNLQPDGSRQGGLLNWNLPLGNQTINLKEFATAILSIIFAGTIIKLALKIFL